MLLNSGTQQTEGCHGVDVLYPVLRGLQFQAPVQGIAGELDEDLSHSQALRGHMCGGVLTAWAAAMCSQGEPPA